MLGKFLAYHNAVPIAVSIMLLGGASAFAATNPEAIYSETEKVLTVDNTYVVDKDFSTYSPQVVITGVTEDDENYYVAFQLHTIDLVDYVWRDISENDVLKVSKAALGPYRDLGLYVTEQLRQKTERELAYLREVQAIERRQVTQKTVATEYGGLVGKLLDSETTVLPGYTPVVTPPPPPQESPQVAGAATTDMPPSSPTESQPSNTGTQTNAAGAPAIQILGNNPARIPKGSTYNDLGAIVSDDKDSNLGIRVFYNGAEVQQVSLNTSTAGEHNIEYRATDTDGNVGLATRVVIVYDDGTITTTSAETPPTPAPQPEATGAGGETTQAEQATTSTQTSNTTSTSTAESSSQANPSSLMDSTSSTSSGQVSPPEGSPDTGTTTPVETQ